MEPILTHSEITGRVYIVTKYRRLNGVVIDAREKFDVTDCVESYAKKCNAQTVEENAKLRTFAARLVRQLFDYTQNPVTRGVICDEASELGIEVDDG